MPALSGPQYLGEGLKLIMRPGLRLFVLIPLTLNLLVFALLIGFAMQQFSHWVDLLMPSLPDWLSFLQYIVWPLFVLLVLVIVFFTFTMVANIISAPFNGFLSEKVEVVVRGRDDFPPFSWAELLAMIPRTMGREMRKLAYFLPRALVLLAELCERYPEEVHPQAQDGDQSWRVPPIDWLLRRYAELLHTRLPLMGQGAFAE
ncbi:hypothetical protein ALP65_02364, partial [Pseudomonas aeruginosa]